VVIDTSDLEIDPVRIPTFANDEWVPREARSVSVLQRY
jgi:hypothetical protein